MRKPHSNILADEIKFGVAGFGGCGVNTVRDLAKFDPNNHHHLHLMAANTDARQLTRKFYSDNESDQMLKMILKKWLGQTGRLKVLQLGKKKEGDDDLGFGHGAGGDPAFGERAAQESEEEIKAFLKEMTAVILTGGMGGGTGTGAIPVVAKYCREMGKLAWAVIVMPFAIEGRGPKALVGRNNIASILPTIVIYNQKLESKEVSLEQTKTMVNESCIVRMLMVMKEMIQEVGDFMNSDLRDLKTLLGCGNRLLFGDCQVENAIEMSQVGEKLLANLLQDSEIIKNARMLMLSFHGAWTQAEIEKLTLIIKGEIKTKLNVGNTEYEPEVHIGTYTTKDKSKWVSMLAAAQEEGQVAVVQQDDFKKPTFAQIRLSEVPKTLSTLTPEPVLLTCAKCYFVDDDPAKMELREIPIPPALAKRWSEFRGRILSVAKDEIDTFANLMASIDECLPEEHKGRRIAPPDHLKELFPERIPKNQPEERKGATMKSELLSFFQRSSRIIIGGLISSALALGTATSMDQKKTIPLPNGRGPSQLLLENGYDISWLEPVLRESNISIENVRHLAVGTSIVVREIYRDRAPANIAEKSQQLMAQDSRSQWAQRDRTATSITKNVSIELELKNKQLEKAKTNIEKLEAVVASFEKENKQMAVDLGTALSTAKKNVSDFPVNQVAMQLDPKLIILWLVFGLAAGAVGMWLFKFRQNTKHTNFENTVKAKGYEHLGPIFKFWTYAVDPGDSENKKRLAMYLCPYHGDRVVSVALGNLSGHLDKTHTELRKHTYGMTPQSASSST